jgi:hypothetical protein
MTTEVPCGLIRSIPRHRRRREGLCENGRRKLGGQRVFRESDSTFIGDWNILLGVVVFVATSGREAAANLIDVALGLVGRVGGACYNRLRAN